MIITFQFFIYYEAQVLLLNNIRICEYKYYILELIFLKLKGVKRRLDMLKLAEQIATLR